MNSANQQQKSRLLHPTDYHIQQLRFGKESPIGIDPTQMLNNPHLLFNQQQQQQQQESPNLSDLDYSELDTTSPGQSRMYRSSGDNFIFDDNSFGIQMKRSSTDVSYYPQDSRMMKQMAGSAPSNMGYFGPSDDIISVATSQNSANLVSSSNDMITDNYNVDDYSTQAK